MKNLFVLLFAVSFFAFNANGQAPKVVGGEEMYPTKNIIENAINSNDHTTLVAAVKAAGLVETLQGEGPFTVFAPTNTAFEALPEGTVPTLLKPENKAQLTTVLTYHVVPGKLDAMTIQKTLEMKDKITLKTVAGAKLTVMLKDGMVKVMDENGGVATVTIADVYQSNGVIHVVDKVLLPK
jgi:uncharacterized surface protein with fasciclin (FAS1) repeats